MGCPSAGRLSPIALCDRSSARPASKNRFPGPSRESWQRLSQMQALGALSIDLGGAYEPLDCLVFVAC
jgi:hypothetical protein